MSAWLDALRALEPGLACTCGRKNTAHARPIQIVDSVGHARCACGKVGAVQEFQEAR